MTFYLFLNFSGTEYFLAKHSETDVLTFFIVEEFFLFVKFLILFYVFHKLSL